MSANFATGMACGISIGMGAGIGAGIGIGVSLQTKKVKAQLTKALANNDFKIMDAKGQEMSAEALLEFLDKHYKNQ